MTLDFEPAFTLRKIGAGRAIVRSGLWILAAAVLIVGVAILVS